ncbi:uncharacterized protein METZ01_LOCUS471054, partial [marine metagenome]
SGVFQGQATIDGISAGAGDWAAAFDEDGNIAGASELILDGGTAYINLSIYGDDSTTPDVDEGMNAGESFYLKLWDSSSDLILDYPDGFDCWYNNNGAPMIGCGGAVNVYDFPSVVEDIDPDFSFSVTASGSGSDYDLTFGFSPDATDDYDSDFDMYAPSPPPPPAFDAALLWGGDRYYTQILNGSYTNLNEHIYDIVLQYASDNLITIGWDVENMSDAMSSATITDPWGGIFININMVDGSGTIDE